MTVHIVASCTERKRAAVRDDLRLRSLRGETSPELWLARLNSVEIPGIPARNLYGGEHWRLVLDLEKQLRARHNDVRLWVASAGYGLISIDAVLKPYSATFSSNFPDSVVRDGNVGLLRYWWRTLCEAHQKSLTELASDGATALVIIASSKYLRAMSDDLESAYFELPEEGLILFSGAGMVSESLQTTLVKVDARVQVALSNSGPLRGTKHGLAARTAQALLTKTCIWPPRATDLQAAYSRLVTDHPPPTMPQRERHDDKGIQEFIEAQLRDEPLIGWTWLLRRWRASGQACEQKRFRGLFRSVKGEIS
jgi:hypothetical protein